MFINIHFDLVQQQIPGFWEFCERMNLDGHDVTIYGPDTSPGDMVQWMAQDRMEWIARGGVSTSVAASRMHVSCDPDQAPGTVNGGMNLHDIDAATVMFDLALPRVPDFVRDVKLFHEKFQQAYDGPPRTWLGAPDNEGKIDIEQDQFRVKFMREEVDEYEHHQVQLTHGAEDVPVLRKEADAHRLDACCDVVFVAIGTAYLHGWDLNEAWRRVVRANMAKECASGEGDDIGKWKIRKPDGWMPPDHTDLV